MIPESVVLKSRNRGISLISFEGRCYCSNLSVIQARIIETGSTFDDLHGSIFQNVINSAKHHGADRIDILINE